MGLPDKMTFHLDQGLQLLETKEMVDSGKIRLIGPMVSSKTYLDRGFFIGPQYYYVLAVLGKGENWDPLLMTRTLMIIEFWVFLSFCIWVGKKWGVVTGLIVGMAITISPYLIIHSRFIWNPHMMLWMTMLAVMVVDKWLKTKKWWWLGLLGIMWGVAFGFHYAAILWVLPLGYLFFKNKSRQWLVVPLGFVAGDLPYIIFELRHNFYNLRTFFWVMTSANNSGRLEAHYLINPLLSFGLVAIIYGLFKIKDLKIRGLAIVVLIGVSYWGQTLIYASERIPLGHPEGWTYATELTVVNKVLEHGCPKDFNIAETISGDTRAYDVRYLLTIRKCLPMAVGDYPKAKTLFLIAPPERPPETESVWEVSSLGKIKVVDKVKIDDKVILYELEKI